MRSYTYHVYGLKLRSAIELPELLSAPPGGEEVEIRMGKVPEQLNGRASKGVLYQAIEGDFILRMKDVGAFRVQKGTTITLEPFTEKPSGLFRVFLLGSVMGAVLHQRGILPVHGSAVSNEKGALVIAGRSAAGKSTLAAALAARSYQLVADDISALTAYSKGFEVQAGIPWLKLWKDALDKTGLEAGGKPDSAKLEKVRAQIEKYARDSRDIFTPEAHPLRSILVLHPWNRPEVQIRELSGSGKFEALSAHIYRQEFIHPLGLSLEHFGRLSKLSQFVRVWQVQRPASAWMMDELCELIEKKIRAHV